MITCHQDHSERKYKTKPQYRHCLAFHQFKDIKCRNEQAPPPRKGGPSAMIGRILDADISQQCQIEQGYQNPAQYAHILHGWLLNHFGSDSSAPSPPVPNLQPTMKPVRQCSSGTTRSLTNAHANPNIRATCRCPMEISEYAN